MNRWLIVLISCLSVISAFSQDDWDSKYGPGTMPFDDKGNVVFSKVIQAEGLFKDDLYDRCKMCIVEIFNSANDVVQLDDKQAGILMVKGFSKQSSDDVLGMQSSGQIWFTLKIECRDERYKITMHQIRCRNNSKYIGNGITLPEVNFGAEELTDDVCLNRKGRVKTAGDGFWRRLVIDCATETFAGIEEYIRSVQVSNESDNW